jgi:CxxC-x17-CxxC domain-containing protein
MAFQDKTLTCRDCAKEFVFSAGEQEFYQSKGLEKEPARCKECRAAKRRSRTGESRPMFAVVCASCNKETEVPFEPRGDRPVYCNDCFQKAKTTK